MKSNRTWLAAALVAMAPALAAAETVKIGVVMTYSGGGAQFAQQIERAMDLYMEQEGNAKLGEHQIELIKRDAKNQAKLSTMFRSIPVSPALARPSIVK
jgi:ABC-type branched-subunit amino acid transport system substrate-binding protein